MWAALTGFLAALPKLVGLVERLVDGIDDIKNKIEEKNRIDFIHEKSNAFRHLRRAKTDQEKIDAAKKLQDLISSM